MEDVKKGGIMPYIKAGLSLKLDDAQKNDLQNKLTDIVGAGLSKPKTYIMTEIEDGRDLYMAGNKLEKGAYICVKFLGTTTKPVCGGITQNICQLLEREYGIDGSNIYVSYHPVDLWGWNGMMF